MNDTCIYCFDKNAGALTDSHIFPKSIGGRVSDNLACGLCNNSIGSGIEAAVDGDIFFARARSEFNIISPLESLPKLNVFHSDTGDPIGFSHGSFWGKPKIEGDRVAGNSEFIRTIFLRDVQKRYPHLAETIKQEYDSKKAQMEEGGSFTIELPDKVHQVIDMSSSRSITVASRNPFPIALIAKIAYEALETLSPFPQSVVTNFFCDNMIVDAKRSDRHRVKISDNFYRRVGMPARKSDGIPGIPSDVKLFPNHEIAFGITKRGIALVRVTFFGAVSFVVTLEPCTAREAIFDGRMTLLFPISRRTIVPLKLRPSESYKRFIEMEDAFVDRTWDALRDRTLPENE